MTNMIQVCSNFRPDSAVELTASSALRVPSSLVTRLMRLAGEGTTFDGSRVLIPACSQPENSVSATTVERIWHTHEIQSQILASPFRSKSFNLLNLLPLRSVAVCWSAFSRFQGAGGGTRGSRAACSESAKHVSAISDIVFLPTLVCLLESRQSHSVLPLSLCWSKRQRERRPRNLLRESPVGERQTENSFLGRVRGVDRGAEGWLLYPGPKSDQGSFLSLYPTQRQRKKK